MNYETFFRLILRHIPPELAHALAARTLGAAGRIGPLRRAVKRRLGPDDPILRVHAFGTSFSTPLGVAAGVDKNATWYEGLGMIGFGSVEVGTATARPQPGFRGRRVERLVAVGGLLNWMGFPNDGAEAIARRLARSRPEGLVVGVNIGKSAPVAIEQAGEDYRRSVRELAHLADYLVLNVSSPNTPGLRGMQASEILRILIADVQDELARLELAVPLLVKLGPDLADEEIDAVADLALERKLAGLVATNTTIDRTGFESRYRRPDEPAGLSGAPLKPRALEVLRRLRARVGDDLVLVAVGGIGTPDDAWERILAGATLVQAYTGFVYGGPLWPRAVNDHLAARAREHGCSSIQEMVGAAARNAGSEPVHAA
ncbi:MAG: quinone-dependent dihydroorotate dehydrogenase [Actinobacteria bacterium]|nr:quinone-dependent dihydroorotate dehydrogenase [Actinomycetota bacterium]